MTRPMWRGWTREGIMCLSRPGLSTLWRTPGQTIPRELNTTVKQASCIESRFTRTSMPWNLRQKQLPGLSAMSSGHLEFVAVSPQATIPHRPGINLTQTTVHVTKPKTRLRVVDLPKVLDHISSNLTCMRWEPAKGSPKLTNCFRMLRNAISLLPDEEVDKLAESYFPSNPLSQQYARDRISILDALSDLDSDFSRKAITDRVLLAEKPETSLAERFLLHVAGKDEPPCDYVVSALESIVFEPEQHENLLSAPTIHNRATLALGAVTRKLFNTMARRSKAEQLAQRLRNLLGMHVHVNLSHPYTSPIPPSPRITTTTMCMSTEHASQSRERRSAMSEQELQDEDTKRVVLLETLGNVAMPACYDHIVSHLERSSSQWIRRAALHALRHYDIDHVKLNVPFALLCR
ncbi:hypothetical protein ElyMa_005371200 [Elysia marginata]|uniref:Vitellogenin domain-containing protein n=1 Tax=Elysia marginata TaxID=1093978 RepID=A0AAV4EDY1_9GAST|nr:hypothetical protein ElyMa_005371200 [Elysia marginata]